jgi:3-hydroxybutyryl-CoA dehydratase
MLITKENEKIMKVSVGEKSHFSKTITESDISLFSGLVFDFHPMHVNAEVAEKSKIGKRSAQSALLIGLVNGVLRNHLPGPNFIILRQQIEFLKPVLIGDTVTVKVEVVRWSPEKRLVTMKMDCFNQSGNDLMTGEAVLLHEPL